jgi:hypothetical protein
MWYRFFILIYILNILILNEFYLDITISNNVNCVAKDSLKFHMDVNSKFDFLV